MKKGLIVALFLGLLALPSNAADIFEASVSFDNEMAPVKTIKAIIPNIESGFYDLYYAINYKPLDMLSADEAVVRKTKASVLISPINSLVQTPSSYNISLNTGKIEQQAAGKESSLMLQLQKYPENYELLFAYAVQLKNSKDYKKAQTVVEAVIEKNPDYALAHFLKADILRYRNKLKESVDEYLYAVELNPYLSDAYYNIAKILEILDDKNLAMDYYKMAYKVSPNDKELKDIVLKNYVEL